MLDLGWQELMIVACVLVLVMGPEELPKAMRGFTRAVAKMRNMANEFRATMLEIANQDEMREIRKTLDDVKSDVTSETTAPLQKIKDDFHSIEKDVKKAVETEDGVKTEAKVEPKTEDKTKAKPATKPVAKAKPATNPVAKAKPKPAPRKKAVATKRASKT